METTSASRTKSTPIEVVKYFLSAVILTLGAAVLTMLVMQKKEPEQKDNDNLVPMVSTYAATEFTGPLDLIVSGSVVPFREIKVAAEVAGRIKRKYPECEAGNYVTVGTKLLEIDPVDYEMELTTAELEIEQSKKSLEETEEDIRGAVKNLELAQTEFKLQQRDYNRMKAIGRSLSKSEMDQSEKAMVQVQTNLTARKNTLESLRARKARMTAALNVSKTRLEKAKVNLERTTIVARDNGIIVQESVEQGDYVNRGTMLFRLEDTSRAEVRCNLTPSELAWIRYNFSNDEPFSNEDVTSVYRLPKTKVEVFETSHPECRWTGVLERFDGIGRDELTKSIPCRVVIDSPVTETASGRKALVRGMYVKCRIEIPPSQVNEKLVKFPSLALRPGDFVWTVTPDKKLKRIKIDVVDETVIEENGEKKSYAIATQVEGRFAAGQKIITSPVPQPVDGADVILESESGDSTAEVAADDPENDNNLAEADDSDSSANDAPPQASKQGSTNLGGTP